MLNYKFAKFTSFRNPEIAVHVNSIHVVEIESVADKFHPEEGGTAIHYDNRCVTYVRESAEEVAKLLGN